MCGGYHGHEILVREHHPNEVLAVAAGEVGWKDTLLTRLDDAAVNPEREEQATQHS